MHTCNCAKKDKRKTKQQKAPRRHPEGTQGATRNRPGTVQETTGGTQRHPGNIQKHVTLRGQSNLQSKFAESHVLTNQKAADNHFTIDASDLTLSKFTRLCTKVCSSLIEIIEASDNQYTARLPITEAVCGTIEVIWLSLGQHPRTAGDLA